VIVQTIAATTTTTGLTVQAELDHTLYPKGIKIPDLDMQNLETQALSPATTSTVSGTTRCTRNPTTRPT